MACKIIYITTATALQANAQKSKRFVSSKLSLRYLRLQSRGVEQAAYSFSTPANEENYGFQAVFYTIKKSMPRNRAGDKSGKNWQRRVSSGSLVGSAVFCLDKSHHPCGGNVAPIPLYQTCKSVDTAETGEWDPLLSLRLSCCGWQGFLGRVELGYGFLNTDTEASEKSKGIPLLDYGCDLSLTTNHKEARP